MNQSLPNLVKALPEVDRLAFGHPELSSVVLGGGDDRLAAVVQTYQALQSQLSRPLRVLDLASEQELVSLGLAAMAPDQYDLVLCLNAFQGVLKQGGGQAAAQILTELGRKVAVGIFELAPSPPSRPSDGQDPRSLLEGFAFFHELGQQGDPASSDARRLYVASNRYWCLDGQAGAFDTWQVDSHAMAQGTHQGTRRYFFGGGQCVKLSRLDQADRGDLNLQEHDNETSFLSSPPPGFDAPRLLLHGRNDREAWLVREHVPGELLLNVILTGKSYDPWAILHDVLAQLVALEAIGLYHNDLRTWNVLLRPDGHASLIDFGAISKHKADCLWPRDIFLAFFVFLHEILTGQIEPPITPRTIGASVGRFELLYSHWVLAFWATPMDQWSFRLMQQLLERMNEQETKGSFVVDFLLDAANLRVQRAELRTQEAEAKVEQAEEEARRAKAEAREAKAAARQAEAETRQARAMAQQAEAKAGQAEANARHWELALSALCASRSWRITEPLRWAARRIRTLRTPARNGCSLAVPSLLESTWGDRPQGEDGPDPDHQP